VYKASVIVLGEITPEQFVQNKDEYTSELIRHLRNECVNDDMLAIDVNKRGFSFKAIKYGSPLSIWAMGIITALAAAVILSGGKAEVWGAIFEINAIGEGLQKIRQAIFPGDPQVQTMLSSNEGIQSDIKGIVHHDD
jgi:hypothetical protein